MTIQQGIDWAVATMRSPKPIDPQRRTYGWMPGDLDEAPCCLPREVFDLLCGPDTEQPHVFPSFSSAFRAAAHAAALALAIEEVSGI